MIESAVDWSSRRAEISHDLLKNQILPAVFKLGKVIDGEVEDSEFFAVFVSSTIPVIEYLCAQVEKLVEEAESSLSPRRYFDIRPLGGLDDDTKRWLPQLLHAKWVEDVQLHARLIRLIDAVNSVRGTAALCCSTEQLSASGLRFPNVENLLMALRQVALGLSDVATLPPYRWPQ